MLQWIDEDHLVVGDTTLLTLGAREEVDASTLLRIGRLRSTPERLVMLKTRRMVEHYVSVLEALRPRRVLELGIYQGGSVALVAEMVAPETLVAIELESESIPALDDWIARWTGGSRIKTYYGVNQTDTAALERIVSDDFDGPLDLIIDDASHWMPESRVSFCALFSRLRPGGIYLVEDWSWAHRADPAFLSDHAPLTLLLFELIVACAHVPGLLEHIEVGPDVFTVRRGPAQLDSATVDLVQYFDARAKDLVPDLGASS